MYKNAELIHEIIWEKDKNKYTQQIFKIIRNDSWIEQNQHIYYCKCYCWKKYNNLKNQ